MARLQILELPEGADDDRPPFVLVVDQANYDSLSSLSVALEGWQNIKDQIGARAVLVFEETIDIPANEITLSDATDGNVVRIHIEPDLTGFTDKVMTEVAKAEAEAAAALRLGQR
ncbi:hypothetical protein [Streptomyces sp900116325]|uniref:hypothetical protein n=1 Tax=Streptomyces sp. 900116325 TaxID=3154295 RepID=UPI0033C58831